MSFNIINKFGEYEIIGNISLNFPLENGIAGYFAEDNQGNECELFVFTAGRLFSDAGIKRHIENNVRFVRAQNFCGLQKIVDCGFDDAENKGFVVYEFVDIQDIVKREFNKGDLLQCIGILNGLRNKNLKGFVISTETLAVQKEGTMQLRYVGVADFMRKKNTANDIRSLADLFRRLLDETSKGQEIFEKCQNGKYRNYLALKADIGEIPLDKSPTDDFPVVQVQVKSDHLEKFKPILQEINCSGCWFQLTDSKQKGEENTVEGYFSTFWYSGRINISKRHDGRFSHIFIPHWGNALDPTVLHNGDKLPFQLSMEKESSDEAVEFFGSGNEDGLIRKYLQKEETVKTWRALPNQEKKFIEDRAFRVCYKNFERSKNNDKNYKFLLEGESLDWQKVNAKKKDDVTLVSGKYEVGKILDYKTDTQTIILRDVENIEEIAHQGELVEDVTQEVTQYKRQVEACDNFTAQEMVNPQLSSILATPQNFDAGKHFDAEPGSLNVINPNLANDETQRNAVFYALHKKPIYLIQGPPGTGKTTVIVELTQQIIKRNSAAKILVVSQTNTAVDNVLERLPNNVSFVRLASGHAVDADKISEKIKDHIYERKISTWVADTVKRVKQQNPDHLSDQANKLHQKWSHHPISRDKKTDSHTKKLNDIRAQWITYINNANTKSGDKHMSTIRNGSAEMGLREAYVTRVNVVGATCMHIATSKYRNYNFKFDHMIMDESSKATAAEALVPINMSRNLVLIGDHRQLPPFVTKEEAIREGIKDEMEDDGLDIDKKYGESLFETLIKEFDANDSLAGYKIMLDVQYRMPKSIGHLISKHFYDGKLKNPSAEEHDIGKSHGLSLKVREVEIDGKRVPNAILFISTSSKDDRYDNGNAKDRSNSCNAETVQEILRKLESLINSDFSVGVIAAYNGQVKLLKGKINRTIVKSNDISTVDKFQGQEKDVIIYDVVRSSKGPSSIGFLSDPRRMNVAFSRARRLLIIVGDSEFILQRAKLPESEQNSAFKLRDITQMLNEWGVIYDSIDGAFVDE